MNSRMDLEDRIRSVFETQGIELNYEQIMKARRSEFPKPRDLDKKLKKMIAPFRWMTEPGKYTLSLEAGLLNNDCFVRNYMLGNGYDWEKIASAFMKKQEIDSDKKFSFDCEAVSAVKWRKLYFSSFLPFSGFFVDIERE